MSIPKIIHCCWFGGAPKPELVVRCMESWRRHLPGYAIMEWNESTFDVGSHPFTRDMHARRRWAFLSDYVRMWAVNKHGGIYLDTDCEVHADLAPLLHHRAFVGFERFFDSLQPFTACFGAEPGHPLARLCLEHYDKVPAGKGDDVTNTLVVSRLMRERYHVEARDRRQDLADGLVIYPSHTLCSPNLWHTRLVTHHFDGSWTSRGKRAKPPHLRAAEMLFRVAPIFLHPVFSWILGAARNFSRFVRRQSVSPDQHGS